MKYLIILLFLSCSKEQLRYHEIWERYRPTSITPGAWCITPETKLDTVELVWNIANPDHGYIKVGYSTRDSLVNGVYYYSELKTLLKSWTE